MSADRDRLVVVTTNATPACAGCVVNSDAGALNHRLRVKHQSAAGHDVGAGTHREGSAVGISYRETAAIDARRDGIIGRLRVHVVVCRAFPDDRARNGRRDRSQRIPGARHLHRLHILAADRVVEIRLPVQLRATHDAHLRVILQVESLRAFHFKAVARARFNNDPAGGVHRLRACDLK